MGGGGSKKDGEVGGGISHDPEVGASLKYPGDRKKTEFDRLRQGESDVRVNSAKSMLGVDPRLRRPSFGSSTREVDLNDCVGAPKVTTKPAIRCGACLTSSKRHSTSFRLCSFETDGKERSFSGKNNALGDFGNSSRTGSRTTSTKRRKSGGGLYDQAKMVGDGLPNIIFGVVEGVGEHAEQAASFVRLFMRSKLNRALDKSSISPTKAEELLGKYFKEMEEAMSENGSAGVDTSQSGTVCTVAYYGEGTIVLGCVGDQRGVLICESTETGERRVVNITPEHVWSNDSERQRAETCGAHVKIFHVDNVGTVGHEAVWENETAKKPGLTTSRALGYTSARGCGVIPTAEFKSYHLESFMEQHKCRVLCVVLASHGFWHVLSQDDLLKATNNIGKRSTEQNFVDAQQLSDALLQSATERWEELWTDNNIQVHCFYPELFDSETVNKAANKPPSSSRIRSARVPLSPKDTVPEHSVAVIASQFA